MKHELSDENLKEEIVNELNKLSEKGGSLFNTIEYLTTNDLDNFISNITKEQSIYCIKSAFEYFQKMGILTIEESEVISKSLRVLSK